MGKKKNKNKARITPEQQQQQPQPPPPPPPVENHAAVLSKLSKAGHIILNQTSNFNCASYGKEKMLLTNGNLWHKIYVQHADNCDRDFVLKTIIDSVYPLDLIPVSYKMEGTIASFIVRNCGPAIEKLARQNFIVQNPNNAKLPYVMQIVLAFSNTVETQLNVQDNITATLKKRYNMNTKTLSLDTFHKDSDLSDLIFCVLSQPKILYFVLHLAKPFQLHTLKMSNNELRVLTPIRALASCKTLTCLDLRNNLIDSMTVLLPLQSMNLSELWLDGNPVCKNHDEYSYIVGVKEMCPTIEKLDGVLLGHQGFPAFRRNFLTDFRGQELVDQFLEHYFTLYDRNNRNCLEGIYHKNAMFSLTSAYIANQTTSSTAKLLQYKNISRNLMTLSDLSKSVTLLSYGSKSIVERLCQLPITEHDPYAFTVDLVHFSDAMAVFVINGVFREPPESLLELERVLGFARTFVLKSMPNGEWQIINELLHIGNATSVMAQKAFKIAKQLKPFRFDPKEILLAKSDSEKNDVTEALKKITTLNSDWAKKCLEDSNWNFLNALSLFVDLFKVDRIPVTAFESSRKLTRKMRRILANKRKLISVPSSLL